MNLYKILDLDSSASIDDIKKNYKRLAKKYHPDKNKDPGSIKKFQEITSAYEILSDDKSRKEYLMLNLDKRNIFQQFLSNILNNSLTIQNLETFGISITKNDAIYLENNFYDVINGLNLTEIINFFKSGQFPKKDFEFTNVCSDTEIKTWDTTNALYLDKLPVELQKHNSQTLRISIDITIEEIINKKEKNLTIKRKACNTFINTDFNFITKKPWVVFSGGGDSNKDIIGDLIIKLNLPNNYDWQDNMIIYNQYISLYEYVYGTNISFKVGNNMIEYNNWVPSREGNIIFIENINFCEYNFAIKLLLNYIDSDIKKKLLNQYFN